MSDEKNRDEARRWLATAEEDLDTARLLKQGQKWAHACFHAQQAAEKAVKALHYANDADPWGHSVYSLIASLCEANPDQWKEVQHLAEAAAVLDRYYIPTRYPNGLPGITPQQAFFANDADDAVAKSSEIIQYIENLFSQQ